jgi:hypothetical protein
LQRPHLAFDPQQFLHVMPDLVRDHVSLRDPRAIRVDTCPFVAK